MWQFFTIEAQEAAASSDLLQSRFALRVTEPIPLGIVEHALTHRRYRFDVFTCESRRSANGEWSTLEELNHRPMPRPHLKIREMLMHRSIR